MVRFEENKLIIEIVTHWPQESWKELHTGLCDLIRYVKQDTIHDDTLYSVVDLLSELMPEE